MPWLKGLNEEQQQAVLHNHGPLLILAGAGSGKTTVLVARTGRLIAESVADPRQIAVLTFTNKAAKELKHRVGQRVGKPAKGIWAGTFHSFGLQLLRKHHKKIGLPERFGIIDGSDALSIIKDLMKNITHATKEGFDAEKLLQLVNHYRSEGRWPEGAIEEEYLELAEVLRPKYSQRLRHLGVVDFEDLLIQPLKLFSEQPDALKEVRASYQQIMVDEFQDTNRVQMRLIDELSSEHNNIVVVGDDDQSIYGWRGACVSNILEFPNRYEGCKVVRLERNYRSTSSILSVANELIKNNRKRHGKTLKAKAVSDEDELPELFIYESEEDEAESIPQQVRYFQRKNFSLKDISVLYRSNGQGAMVEAILRQNQIPYSMTGGTAFFDRREVRDVLAYLRAALAPNEVAVRRIINTPARGFGEASIEKIHEYARMHNMSFLKALRLWKEAGLTDKLGEQAEKFLELISTLVPRLLDGSQGKSCGENLLKLLDEIGYRSFVFSSYKDSAVAEKKWNIVEIFARVLDSFALKGGRTTESLLEFIDCMELRDPVDEGQGEQDDKVQLLTLHACKGLEFPVVLLLGLEEDILPHKVLGTDIDEERRLFYVGITRAQKHLVMSRVQKRKRYGRHRPSTPSRFLLEIPSHLIRSYPEGVRPVTGDERKSMLTEFLMGLDRKIEQASK